MSNIRTRFAPSPTGYMHIGNLRTALYSYLLAKKNKGKFILRIEDTDQERIVKGAIDLIYKTLLITGLKYDEGPNIGGNYGPYIQSQRKEIYLKYAKKLVEKGGAYYCFYPQEKINYSKEELLKYNENCKKLSKNEIKNKLDKGNPYVIRQLIPLNKDIIFNDLVFGKIKANTNDLDEGVLIKTNGFPTYNFANVVDDHLMKISHVLRGAEYLSSTPKYILIYKSFGWSIPKHIHLPLILKNANKKFSKRDRDSSFIDLLKQGYLKEAIINYIALLGWNPKNEREIFSLKELKTYFNVAGIHKTPAVFDINKLNWINSVYIKNLDFDKFHKLSLPYYQKVIKKQNIDTLSLSKVLQTRINKFSEIPEKIDFLEKLPNYKSKLFENKKMKSNKEISLRILKITLCKIDNITEWTEENIRKYFFNIINKEKLKNGQVLWPIRIALSGKEFTPGGAIEIAKILGPKETKIRIVKAINKLKSNI